MSEELQLIRQYFPDLSELQLRQFQNLESVFKDWNDKINLVSRKDTEFLTERHILHSLGIARCIDFQSGSHILDVGTGGGFPGIPLAILFPESQFHLIDSIGKKIKAVEGIVHELGLKNVSAEQVRAEDHHQQYDFVVSRAVTRLARFLPWVEKNLKEDSNHDLPNGLLCLKGGDLDEELLEVKNQLRVYPLNEHFGEEFFDAKKVIYVQC